MALPRIASLSGVVLPKLELSAEADLPTRYGALRVVGFQGADGQELGAVVQGAVDGHVGVPVRLHSECFTGDLMGSLRCDCRDQLEASLRFIARCARGAVLYLPQEGRGIGLVNKIRAYALQDRGLDTVDANLALGFPNDLRTYEIAAAMIRALGIQSVCLLTNNPAKVHGLQRHGIEVAGIIPLRTPPNEHNVGYLNTKRQRSGHLL